MEAKLSSVSTMSDASLATSVPVMPMATPMSACLSAGPSLTPSPVMATTWPRACSASTRRSFCSGVTRAKTEYVARGFNQLFVGKRGKLLARQHQGAGRRRGFLHQPQLPPDRHRRPCVIARDHLDLDAGAVTRRYGLDGFRPRRVNHPLQAKEGELVRQAVGADALGVDGQLRAGEGQHAQAGRSEIADVPLNALAVRGSVAAAC